MLRIFNLCFNFQKVFICENKFFIQCDSPFTTFTQTVLHCFQALNYTLLNLTLNSISEILILSKHYKNVMNILRFYNYYLSNLIQTKRENC